CPNTATHIEGPSMRPIVADNSPVTPPEMAPAVVRGFQNNASIKVGNVALAAIEKANTERYVMFSSRNAAQRAMLNVAKANAAHRDTRISFASVCLPLQINIEYRSC